MMRLLLSSLFFVLLFILGQISFQFTRRVKNKKINLTFTKERVQKKFRSPHALARGELGPGQTKWQRVLHRVTIIGFVSYLLRHWTLCNCLGLVLILEYRIAFLFFRG